MVDSKLSEYLKGFVTPSRLNKFKQVLNYRTKHFAVVLEDVYQMHNTSAVIRSCDVFGVQDAHAIEVKNKNKLDHQITMGAQKWVSMHYHNNVQSCINKLRNEGYQIIATSPHTVASNLESFDISKKSALFFGSEKEGISSSVQEAADGFLQIPMVGFTESLNISVSAAIVLERLTTRLRKSEIKWQLSQDEMAYYELEWMKQSIQNLRRVMNEYN